MEWVKASERLPDNTGYYFVKYKVNGAYILYVKNETNMGHVVSWLDENTPSLTLQQGLDIWDAAQIYGMDLVHATEWAENPTTPNKAAYFASIGIDLSKIG